jgi:hypothetical protein
MNNPPPIHQAPPYMHIAGSFVCRALAALTATTRQLVMRIQRDWGMCTSGKATSLRADGGGEVSRRPPRRVAAAAAGGWVGEGGGVPDRRLEESAHAVAGKAPARMHSPAAVGIERRPPNAEGAVHKAVAVPTTIQAVHTAAVATWPTALA